MGVLAEYLPWLTAMVLLIGCSAFFSASEAALFSLRSSERRALGSGTRSQQVADRLLAAPERLLSSVLFWNLVTNILYFATASVVGLRLEEDERGGQSVAFLFGCGSLLAIIFFSEMLPKSVAVLSARRLAPVVAIPLAVSARLADPIMPALRVVNLLSTRLVWPRLKPEPYMEMSDIERAIEMSSTNQQLVEQEHAVLRNIVLLSDIRADEWMRPRTQFRSFQPPVSFEDLGGQMTPSGYLLITERESEEVVAALHLKQLTDVPQQHLEHLSEPVIYVPWCSTVATTLERMQKKDRQVAAVVNEYGETIGILTFEDILDTLFNYSPSRSGRLLDHEAINQVDDGTWHVTGMTSLRSLGRHFDISLPPRKSVTVGGVIQETLQRLADAGDSCQWGPFRFRVLQSPSRGKMLVELTWWKEPPSP